MNKASHSRLTIGYLTYYQNEMTAGVFEAAHKHNVNLVCFSCSRNTSDTSLDPEVVALFKLIKEQNLDGLLFLGWIQVIGIKPEDLKDALSPLPLYSLGTSFNDIPHIYMDGSSYYEELLIHLIEVHNCRKIVYISPIMADSRNRIYEDVMKKYNLYDPELIIKAEELLPLSMDSADRAQKALSLIFNKYKLKPDAIASTYSREAAILIQELHKRGVKVPEDIKIIGYEDTESGKYTTPPLTTVYYPFWEIGFYGCERFIERLTNKEQELPLSTLVPGRVVLRGSCSCRSPSVKLAGTVANTSGHSLTASSPCEELQAVKERIMQLISYPDKALHRLLQAFFDAVMAGTNTSFLPELEEQILMYHNTYSNTNDLEDLISGLQKVILPYFLSDISILTRAENLFHQARIIIRERAFKHFGRKAIQNMLLYENLQKMSQQLLSTFSTDKLLNTLELNLSKINIRSCYLFLLTSEHEPDCNCTLIFKYVNNRREPLDNQPVFTSTNLLKNFYSPGNNFIIISHLLSITNKQKGIALFEPGPVDERIYQALAVQLSTVLRGTTLVTDLEKANEELKATQQKLVGEAHKAGMADIATGTLHNVGNVMNSVNTSVHLMQLTIKNSLIEDLKKANCLVAENAHDLKNFMLNNPKGKLLLQFYAKLGELFGQTENTMFYHLERLTSKIKQVNDIIVAQQNYAETGTLLESIDLKEIVEDALTMQLSSLVKNKIQVIKNFKNSARVTLQKIKFLHVLINLFDNAKDAMQKTPEQKRKLIITLEQENNHICLKITDTGQGIPAATIKQLFTGSFTTKGNGHGFGLLSCAGYIRERGGEIRAESPGPGKGATFIVRFNIK